MNIFEENNITKEEFEHKEIAVLKQMVRPYCDVFDASSLLMKNDSKKYIEIDLILAFVLADTCSRYFEILEGYQENAFGSEKRFTSWIDTFVLNNDNPVYKEKQKEIKYVSSHIWKLRCSLVHFYGLPSSKSQNGHIILNAGFFNQKHLTEELRKRGVNIIVIDPLFLKRIIHNSLKPWEIYLKNLVKAKPEIYLPRMLNIFEIIQLEGIEKISRNDFSQ